MKIPAVIKTYCPFCKKHTEHKVREHKEGKRRTLAWGQVKFIKQTKGYKGKKAGKPKKVKQRKKVKLMLECMLCHKKHEKILPHTKKKIEIKKKE